MQPRRPFGGFSSCQVGIPLTGPEKGQSLSSCRRCSTKTAQQGTANTTLTSAMGAKSSTASGRGPSWTSSRPLSRPPSCPQRPLLNNSSSSHRLSVLADSSGQQVWVRLQVSSRWQLAKVNAMPLPANLLGQAGCRPSAEAVAGACVGTIAAVVAVALGEAMASGTARKRCEGPS